MSAAIDPVVSGALRGALAWLLGMSAWHKLRDPAGFSGAIAGYGLAPPRVVPALAAAVPVAELGLATALLVPAAAAAAALATGALLAAYAGAMLVALARGRRGIECGCGGPGGGHALGPHLVARNAVLVAAALAAALPAAPRGLGWVDAVTLAGALATLACLFAAADLSLEQAARGRRLRARSEP